jgi:apolipoprotein N-acyltransferase
VTSNGYSAVIDATGTVTASSRMGERTLVIGQVAVGEPPRTLMVIWGDWVGLAATALLLILLGAAAWRRWATPSESQAAARAPVLPAHVVVLPPPARIVAALLRAFARASLLWMAAAVLWGDGPLHASTLSQMRMFAALFLAPEVAAWCVLRAFAARPSLAEGHLVLARGRQGLRLALRDIAALEPWKVPLPSAGAWLRLSSGDRWRFGIAGASPAALRAALVAAGAAVQALPTSRWSAYLEARAAAARSRLEHPLVKFVLLPLVLAIPAFRLHQHIAYGSGLGEFYTFGLKAYAEAFGLWWAAWAMGVVLGAAVLRLAIESGTLVAALLRPASAMPARRGLERAALVALYVGLPAWLVFRLLAP